MWRFSGTLLVSIFSFAAFAGEPQAGVIKSVRGEAVVIRNNSRQPCIEGMRIAEGDTIRTQAGASVGIIMLDGARLGIGERTELSIKRFVFEPAESNYSLAIQVLNGIVAYVSGKIGRFSPKSVEIQTPVGMIGTRGTTLAAKIEGARP